jgi:V/A-type H+-transporting ATPase subunit B
MQDVRSLASVIGEEELGDVDQKYLKFGRAFEKEFVNQSLTENRTIEQTLIIGWRLLSMLPKDELTRVSLDELKQFYKGEDADH